MIRAVLRVLYCAARYVRKPGRETCSLQSKTSMGKLWRAVDTAEGYWDYLKPGCIWLLLNLMWVAMLGAAYYYGHTSWELTRSGASAVGTVVALKESPATQDSGVTYTPVIRYEVDGRAYTFTSSNSSDPPAYKVSQRVGIIYDPAEPARARVNSWRELWLMPVILGAAALVVAAVVNTFALVSIMRRFKSSEE